MTGYRAVQRQPQAVYHLSDDLLQTFYAARDRHTSQSAAAAAIAAATQFHLQQGQQGPQFEGQYTQATRRRVQPTHLGSRIPQPSLSSPTSSSATPSSSSSVSTASTYTEHSMSGMRAPSPTGHSPSTPPSYHHYTQRLSVPNSQLMMQHQQQQQAGRAAALHQQPPRDFANAYPMKPVYKLSCKHCCSIICARGMKAILLADTRIELYSTDTPPRGSVQLMDKDYLTRTCRCRIRDIACLGCGNIAGYHVVSPCFQCLEACNNGHFWMFHSEFCQPSERMDGSKTLLWSSLPRAEMDVDFVFGNSIRYETMCR